jgi:hypothetical protein
MSISTFIAGLFIKSDITALETAFEGIIAKAEAAVPSVRADITLAVTEAKTIFVKYKPEAEAELAKIEADIKAAEAAVVAVAKRV